ncbi:MULTISPECIES: hypothetical protein [unclassified Streptomyces]|uniref:hypothetical protein n=1 Tax=unclassified Streptomyces TaxID=2593676 RepID=UPI001446F94D|nr:hypothetical protein [Streptomyces sp. A1136]
MHRFATTLLLSATALIALPGMSAHAATPGDVSVAAVAGVARDIGWDSAKPAPSPLPGA